MNLNIVVLLSPPGGGKGSLAKLLKDSMGCVPLSTGNLCRDHIARKTEIGKEIDFIMKSGKLIPDSIISDMVDDWMLNNKDSKNTIILDGYPRTVEQAKVLTNLLNTKFKASLNIVRLLVTEQAIINRLTLRVICKNNKCQATYSSEENSPMASAIKDICDKCQSDLIKRSDDRKEAIVERLATYNRHEQELLNYYNEIMQPLIEINGEQEIEKVFEDFKRLVIS